SSSTVEPEGWVELITMSTESASFEGCSTGQSVCGDECTDLREDPDNCGECGKRCPGSQACGNGTCGGSSQSCEECIQGAQSGTCASSTNACFNDSACSALLQCLGSCNGNQSCLADCESTHAAGVGKASAYVNCLEAACASACG